MARKMLIDGELDKTSEEEIHYDFDLFVIGAGSGGVRASRFSAQNGAKNYDNWERLVRAVMREEELRRIALRPSMDSITISSESSSFRAGSTYGSPMVNGSFSCSPSFEFPAVNSDDQGTIARSESLKNLPPGPPTLALIASLIWLRRPISELEFFLRGLKTRYGPLMTISAGPRKLIYVGSHSLAHRALIQHGAIFSDRPPPRATSKILNRTRIAIKSAAYGPTWRLLRRNLTHEILHPSRVKSYSSFRRWGLSILISRLNETSKSESSVKVIDHLQYAMFCVLVRMCFGDKLQEAQIKEIESVQRGFLLRARRFDVLNFWPSLGKILFRNRWKELIRLRLQQENMLIPLIRSRIQAKQQKISNHQEDDEEAVLAYVDTLIDLQLPKENRKFDESEMASLCSEFLNTGTYTTFTALQWIMANLVKYPHIQTKLYDEIISVVGSRESSPRQMVEEENLQKMPYLKAIVLEALRRHPPAHFVPHKVTQDVELDAYLIPRDATVNFMVADMGWDPKVWEDPMEFKPERFLATSSEEAFDITGSREIKMMPFGAGRRICPGLTLALLHLEYFVANLIWNFEWIPVEGDDVDLSEKQEFTTVMKNPLRARISPRI